MKLLILNTIAFFTFISFAQATMTEEEVLVAIRAISGPVEGTNNRCLGCHDPNMRTISDWGTVASWRIQYCLEAVTVEGAEPKTAKQKLDCLRGDENEAVPFKAERLGLLSTGVKSKLFKDIFIEAYGTEVGATKHETFVKEAGMPRGHRTDVSEAEFDLLYRWVKSDFIYFDRLLATETPAPTKCEEFRSPKFDAYLRERRNTSWESYHQDRGTKFFGCQTNSAAECFNGLVDGKENWPKTSAKYFSQRWNANSDVTMRLIAKLPKASGFWTRSSPDGKYLGIGLREVETVTNADGTKKEYQAMMIDLKEADLTGTMKGTHLVEATYDPTFTPDGSGFMFNGLRENYSRAGVCPMSVLGTEEGKTIEFDELGCSKDRMYTYQSMGTSLEGQGNYVMTGIYIYDDAGGQWTSTRDRQPKWGVRSFIELTHMPYVGDQFRFDQRLDLWTPFSGDWMISPSTELAASRTAGVDENNSSIQLGFQFFMMSHADDKLALEPALRMCEKGAKGTFSMDERFFVFHHFVEEGDYQDLGFASPEDAEFKAMLDAGTANIFVTDLLTGDTKRLTRMEYGQVAAFPHFRADGWLYFLVRDQSTKTEWLTGAYWKR